MDQYGSAQVGICDWPLQVNDSEHDFTAPWRQVRWMRDSLSSMSLPAGAVSSEHKEAALKHIQGLHDFADRDLQGLIIPHGIIPIHVSKLLLLFGWYAGMLKSFRLQFTKDQPAVGFNLSELHNAHVLHHWRLVGIPMISQEVHYVGASTVATCHLCNHPFRNLYEIKESGDQEKALFAAVTRKHQIEADRVIGGIGSTAAVTMLRDALLSTARVCLGCTARVLGARYQRREARDNVHTTQSTDTDMTVAIPTPVAPAGEVRVSEAIFAGSTLNASHGQMATDSAPRRSERVTRQPAKLLDAPDAYAAPITPLRNMACERKAVTAEMRAIGLRPDGKQMLLNRVSASRTLRLLKKFRQGYCPMIGQKFSSCDPVPPALHTKVRIEVHQPIVNLPWLQAGQQGTITSVRKVPWRTTAWRAGGKDVRSVKVAKRASESFKQSSSAMRGKTVTSDLQRVVPSGNDAEEELPEGRVSVGHGGNRQAGGGVPLTPDEKKEKRRVQNQKKRTTQKPSTSQKSFNGRPSGSNHSSDAKVRHTRHLEGLSQK